MSLPDTKLTIEVRIYYEQKNVMFRFSDESEAEAFYQLSNSNTSRTSSEGLHGHYDITMPIPSGLKYVRAGAGAPSMIFGFEDEDAAKRWIPESVLGDDDGKEVRIKLKWHRDELKKRLTIEDEEGPGTALHSTGIKSLLKSFRV